MENRAGPTTPFIGADLTRRTRGIAVSVAFLAIAGGKQSLVTSAATNSQDFEQAARVPAVRAWRRQEALLGAKGAFLPPGGFRGHKSLYGAESERSQAFGVGVRVNLTRRQ